MGVVFICLRGVERQRRERRVLSMRVVSDFVLGDSVFIIILVVLLFMIYIYILVLE